MRFVAKSSPPPPRWPAGAILRTVRKRSGRGLLGELRPHRLASGSARDWALMGGRGRRLSRRPFVVGAGASSAALLAGCGRLSVPPLFQTPPASKVARIGSLWPGASDDGRSDSFRRGLRELGYVE